MRAVNVITLKPWGCFLILNRQEKTSFLTTTEKTLIYVKSEAILSCSKGCFFIFVKLN